MLILKGIIIGIGKIIPGVSGSMLAISMGIYQKMIDSVNNFFKDIKSNFLFFVVIISPDNIISYFNAYCNKGASKKMLLLSIELVVILFSSALCHYKSAKGCNCSC